MQTEDGALDDALGEALAELSPGGGAAKDVAVDHRSLGIGLRLGLEHPETARHLLGLLEGGSTDPAAPSPVDAAGVPVASSLLARSAALPWSERADPGPEVRFGWAAGLKPAQILSLGRVVHEMLAEGSPADVGRGFGLTWDAGVRLPGRDRDAMFREFTQLEVTVGGVLAGRDLRAAEPAPRPRGIGAILDQIVTRARPEDALAAAALEGGGEPARRGLVALWNAWMAMRYRSLVPQPTFDLLVRPWVTVVGPLPD